ncbi:histidine--tRNA ligase [Phycisphaera mikurensis]|uniref:Histidine--tRNA ligase n=1 Tax=Phycisphaera mikurensis (strain NBRC 102666 / KCTC 22515 / FYK2301M01) TaxID=1142394 RepID=I0IC74_PHYMF|nr:histidine--tRNA ligase [Phycisphaera mikurensis]MBB6441919.1 histidyl-tRNA synthetase [Phycisphaera mikurensis]BAM02862.1 histidyl-tRNA synthetase [Phycisphaera mikurensis NBRC 102666]
MPSTPVSDLQAPRGTRDFYPEEMARHRRLLDAWRRVSLRNGFEEVDGPIFETLDLYKVKSGDGIVSELFSFRRDGGSTDYALRAEFTPTLARMVAKRANGLPKPIKWFATPNFCRAERPQRGRLREFWQWNVDFLGEAGPSADAEVVFVLVDLLRELGVREGQVQVRISHRAVVAQVLQRLGVPAERLTEAFELLDSRSKLEPGVFAERAAGLGLDPPKVQRLDEVCRRRFAAGDLGHLARALGMDAPPDDLVGLDAQLVAFGIAGWCAYDLGVVRGLAYYTGTVFEAFETAGVERALAGGGRYDRLIETFGGPAMPAVGFGMGDVVLANLLRDKKLEPEHAGDGPDVFIVPLADADPAAVTGWVARLRSGGLHARTTYKPTRNTGKLLKEATGARARFALLVGVDSLELKNLATGEQQAIADEDVASRLR